MAANLDVKENARIICFEGGIIDDLTDIPWKLFLCLYKSWCKDRAVWVTYEMIGRDVWDDHERRDRAQSIQQHKATLVRALRKFDGHVIIESGTSRYRLKVR
jgi:hypothetical protein